MENRVDEFCLWIIQAIIIPITVGTIEGWSTGYFDELDKYEEEYCKLIHSSISDNEEENKNRNSSFYLEKDLNQNTNNTNTNSFWNFFTKKNTMYFILATQAIHLIYAVYIGKQFPVQPFSEFENSNIIWETVCLCARDATIALNSHILILRVGCRVIYEVGASLVMPYIELKSTNKGSDENHERNERNESNRFAEGNSTNENSPLNKNTISKLENDNLNQSKICEQNNWIDILDVD